MKHCKLIGHRKLCEFAEPIRRIRNMISMIEPTAAAMPTLCVSQSHTENEGDIETDTEVDNTERE